MSRRTSAKSLRRTPGTRPERRTIVVFSEGKNTECDYIKALKRLPEVYQSTSLRIVVDPTHGVDPLTLVQTAVSHDGYADIDECWCFFDVECPVPHAHLKEAKDLADRKRIKLAISNPCFELWLLLHFELVTAALTTKEAESRYTKYDKQYNREHGKRIDATLFTTEEISGAVSNAKRLEQRHTGVTVFPEDNPSSGMHRFIEAIGLG